MEPGDVFLSNSYIFLLFLEKVFTAADFQLFKDISKVSDGHLALVDQVAGGAIAEQGC